MIRWLKRREQVRIHKAIHGLILSDPILSEAYDNSGHVRYALGKIMSVVHEGRPWTWWDVYPEGERR